MSIPGLHVQIDQLLCQGTGYCERLAADIFEVGPDYKGHVLEPHPAAERKELLEEAATLCPSRAITY